jgi:hypothetical protein
MRRRDFVKLFAGSATTWPLAARAQQGEQVRRIGMLWPFSADDPRGKASLAALQQALRQLGWTEGRNLRIDARWFAGNPDDNRKNAAELIALAPDLIFAPGGAAAATIAAGNPIIPVVFAIVPTRSALASSKIQWTGRRQRHGLPRSNTASDEMGGIAQSRSHRASSGWRSFGIRHNRDRPVGRRSGRGAVIRCGVKSDQRQ